MPKELKKKRLTCFEDCTTLEDYHRYLRQIRWGAGTGGMHPHLEIQRQAAYDRINKAARIEYFRNKK